ncbi:MAG: T9SS type A sorting domain-containing protein [Saprospiraceae bacterium]|nr:T9SS type A sorting domain-containing protein [Saprospiraceae bacterium]
MLKSYLSKILVVAVFTMLAGSAFAQLATVTVDAPASIADEYYGKIALWSPVTFAVTGDIAYADDMDATTGTINDGCQAIGNVSGKVALIDRGTCNFAVKAVNAQQAGAIAIIICNNNVNNPYTSIVMGGTPTETINIPGVMLSYNDCQTIKAELGANTVSITLNDGGTPAPSLGEDCSTAVPVTAGTHTTPDMVAGLGGYAGNGYWYSYTSATKQKITVSSCGGGANTRLFVVTDGCGTQTDVASGLGVNDVCEISAGGAVTADRAEFIAEAGVEYFILWDDFSDYHGFEWTLTEEALPDVDVTFRVDMQDQTVGVGGTKLLITGATGPVDMVDEGNGIWSYTASITAGSSIDYVFINGATPESNPDLLSCRTIEVGLDAVTVQLVCFNSCSACPPDVACPNWIDEDFEGYNLGILGSQDVDDVWTTWSLNPGGADDAVVVNTQASSGAQSVEISNAAGDDVIMLLGNRTSGNYILKWRMKVPTGKSAYYNLQKNSAALPNPVNADFALAVTFNADGTGTFEVGGFVFNFDYPHDSWFEAYHEIDLDNDWAKLNIAGAAVAQWPISWAAGAQTGVKQIGGIDFYGNAGDLYYIDDILFKQVDACPANAILCDGFDGYDLGLVGPQSPWWTAWSNVDGGNDDGEVTNAQFLSCEQALKVSAATPAANSDDIILNLGDRSAGNYSLSWDMFIPAGKLAYFNVQKNVAQLPTAATADYMMEVYFNANGAGVVNAGGATSSTFTYTYDNWFKVQQLIDLDNNKAQLWVNGTLIQEYKPSWNIGAQAEDGYQDLGGVDFYGAAGVLYYVDNVLFEALPATPGNICDGAIDLNGYLGGGIGVVVSTELFDNTNYSTDDSDPAEGWDCFGEPDGLGATPELNNTMWFTFTGDGETYFIETGDCGAANYLEDGDAQMAIFSGECGALTPVACNEDSPNAVAGNYIAGLEFPTVEGEVYTMMVDGFHLTLPTGEQLSAGEFCLNFTQLTGTPIVDVTFRVNMERETVSAGNVRIAGSFTGWADEIMTNLGNDIWEYTTQFEAGETIQWKFKNGPNGWENNAAGMIECGIDDGGGNVNRTATIGDANETLGTYCFNYCVDCDLLNANESAFSKSVGVNPNPAGTYVNVTYKFDQSMNLNVRLVNTLGQTLIERNLDNAINGSERFDIASLPSGAYSVVFSNGQQAVAKRLIIE